MQTAFRRIYNGVLRRIYRAAGSHPTSFPYISGDSFRSMADHVFDNNSYFDPMKVKKNAVIFVQSPKLREFFENLHPRIQNSYILISHNGDENIDDSYLKNIDGKLIHWFAQNCCAEHPKLTPLPIGLENKDYRLHGVPSYFNKFRKQKAEDKSNEILYKFSASTNFKERSEALAALSRSAAAKTYDEWKEPFSYLSMMRKFKFIASPPGNGEDCHRTWEAMYLGAIPIVKSSVMARYFQSLGLPLLLIDDWKEVELMNSEKLEDTYATIVSHQDLRPLWMDYWIGQINSKKTR